MKIAVFCSANNDIDSRLFELTEEFGRRIGKEGHTLVYGGCNTGLMECVARGVHEEGGMNIGVVPDIVEKGSRKSDLVDVEIPCDSLNMRKELMLNHADVVVALPGGIGTLDELFTVAASASIGYHQKKVILYNMCGFWNKLIEMLNDLDNRGMTRGGWRKHIVPAQTLDEVMDAIAANS